MGQWVCPLTKKSYSCTKESSGLRVNDIFLFSESHSKENQHDDDDDDEFKEGKNVLVEPLRVSRISSCSGKLLRTHNTARYVYFFFFFFFFYSFFNVFRS